MCVDAGVVPIIEVEIESSPPDRSPAGFAFSNRWGRWSFALPERFPSRRCR
jgi:hypothetical protein